MISCATCVHYESTGETAGKCQCFPPAIIDDGRGGLVTGWPTVQSTDKCGQYRNASNWPTITNETELETT